MGSQESLAFAMEEIQEVSLNARIHCGRRWGEWGEGGASEFGAMVETWGLRLYRTVEDWALSYREVGV